MMKRWSIKVVTLGDTTVRIHFTFFLLLVWIAAIYWQQGGIQAAIEGVVFISLVFLCVVLHEFGHAFAARRYGIKTPDITLLPIGGVASIEKMPENPAEEIVVALAGPAVNVVIAAVLILLLGLSLDESFFQHLSKPDANLLAKLAAVNIVLVAFNLLPAFPMDGGRVFRAVLATKLGMVQATRIASTTGQILAMFFLFLGLLGNPLLILIAFFVFFAATAESQATEMREIARGISVSDAMITSFKALSPSSTADDASALLLQTTQQEFPVLDNTSHLQGVVTRDSLIKVLNTTGGTTPVVNFMLKDVVTVARSAPLEEHYEALTRKARIIAVTNERNEFLGYINSENFFETFLVGSAKARHVAAHQ